MRRGRRSPVARRRPLKTLERVLSKAGIGSRKQARRLIHARRVEVNGRLVENPDHWVDLDRDKVRLDGRPLARARNVYLLLHKPAGYLTTRADPQGRPTVYDLLREVGEWVFPVGRLDLDTSGLLLLTNDTQFGERLTNPRYSVPKTYLVKTATPLSEESLDRLRRGVRLSDGPTRPAEVRRLPDASFEITIAEGRNRQVRRMVEAVGSKVVALARTSIGPIRIGDLPCRRSRRLTRAEVAMLRRAVHGAGARAANSER